MWRPLSQMISKMLGQSLWCLAESFACA
uniref:Uncharacterized protein n=1 Tax=Arundo donax TaxID=35708 RepID=A0A0A9A0W4_ARUDO